jgi:hypothetical protein
VEARTPGWWNIPQAEKKHKISELRVTSNLFLL